jgi:hypothetical protein
MRRTGPISFAGIAFACVACSGRVIERAPRVDGGTHASPPGDTPDARPNVIPPSTAEAGPPPERIRDATPPIAPTDTGTVPNPACPGVYAGGVPTRDGPSREGIAALRARVLASRDAFQRYTATHHDTYEYTRYRETGTGEACSTTVQVTTGAVSSVRVGRVSAGGTWMTETYSPRDPEAASCFDPVTMYDLYDECLTRVLCQDPRTNYLSLQVDARGLLVQCGYSPDGCYEDGCYQGLAAIILTADGKDWTDPVKGCCPISPEPACCMEYGGWVPNCRTRCDVKPSATEPGWHIAISLEGCAQWVEPPEGTYTSCCGCVLPDASSRPRDGGN